MKSGIYLIKNIVNNKVYVGSAVNIDKRWKEHKYSLNKGKHHSCHFQSAWYKYGEQNFTFDIIEEVSNPEHLLAYEQVYLDYYKSYEKDRGYNICKVAGSFLGMKHSEETKQKIGEASKGKINSEETKQKIGEASKGRNVGRKHTEEARRKIGEASKGKINSEETRKKMSEAKKGRIFSEEHKKKMSEAAKRRVITEETKQKMSEAKKGKKLTEETKQKMSEAKKDKKLTEETKQKMREAKEILDRSNNEQKST